MKESPSDIALVAGLCITILAANLAWAYVVCRIFKAVVG